MRYFFQDTFIQTIHKLLKKNSYKDCEQALIENIFKVSEKELFVKCAAYRLNLSAKNPIVKMRLSSSQRGKSSSYRLYFFVIQHENKLYFGHLYPKTGARGKNALTTKEEKSVIKSLLMAVKEKNLKEVYYNNRKNKIYFVENHKKVW